MKRTLTLSLLALFLLCACDPKPNPEEPTRPQTPEELIVGAWNNTANSNMALIAADDTEVMNYDANSFTFTFGNDGTLIMDYYETDLTMSGRETTTYILRNDSLILGDDMIYTISLLTDSILVLDFSEPMGEDMIYQEHLEMTRCPLEHK